MSVASVAVSTSGTGNFKGTELCCNWDICKAHAMLEEEGEKERINKLENGNIQHITLNDAAQKGQNVMD